MKRRTTIVTTFSLVLCAAAFGLVTGCEETKSNGDGGSDSGITPIPPGPDGGGNTLPFDCVRTPTTATDILNQCPPDGTEYVNKQSSPPLLLSDGGLPPLP